MSLSKEVIEFLSNAGKKGGSVKGPMKRRSKEYYAELSKIGVQARKKKAVRRSRSKA